MPETKYTTLIYLAVRSSDKHEAGKAAAHVYQDLMGRLLRVAPSVKGLRLALEEPTERKNTESVFECWANLKALVPDTLMVTGPEHGVVEAASARDAWRSILKLQFNLTCHHNHENVFHTSSRVEITREVLPHEEVPQEAVVVEEKPKELIPVKVTLAGQAYSIEIPKGENLLDGVNDKKVDVKWDCKSGVCDTCQVLVIGGMENLSPPNDAEQEMLGDKIKQGYRLSCQVVANGPCEIKQ